MLSGPELAEVLHATFLESWDVLVLLKFYHIVEFLLKILCCLNSKFL